MASVKVAVRVRPFNQREFDLNARLIIQMNGKRTGIINNKANARDENIRHKEFTFDYSYWSYDEKDTNYTSQEQVYNDLGTEIVDCAFEGYNACVFAYGQTGSGKTFTMTGSQENQGLIPRICKALFDRMSFDSKRGTTHRVHVSYLEIYQERVADLLKKNSSTALRVREHPKKGPYVQGLTSCLVTSYHDIQQCMNRGNSQRTTAATNMNDVSSRSHAIFTITFVQAGFCDGVPSETVSKIHLVDLAGSERADATCATGQRLKEGAHINKSLVTLGSVISALSELSLDTTRRNKANCPQTFIPYRDSVLTWLLRDSLGGNSKTIMIATISPADCNYGETLSTLRYANRAKNIINKPTINEDPNVKLIRELRDEISKLKSLMFVEHRSEDMMAELHEKEAREKELTEEWTGKWREAQAILREQRALGLRKAGPGVVLDSDRPHLVAIDDDPLSTGVTLYHLKEGVTTIGTDDGDDDDKQDIVLRGNGMEPKHCTITFVNGVAILEPKRGAQVWLNNALIESPARLSQGCIIFLGRAHVFRFNDPAEAAELRKGENKSLNLSRLSLLSWSTPDLVTTSMDNLQQTCFPYDESTNTTADDRTEIANQRLSLVKEKENLEKEQEEFEKRRKSLEEAQARLEVEKRDMEREHAEQARQLQENWRTLTAQQKDREKELFAKEQQLIGQREELELERCRFVSELDRRFSEAEDLRANFLTKLDNAIQIVSVNINEITFPDSQSIKLYKELLTKTCVKSMSSNESDLLVDILNGIKGKSLVQELINQHRQELAELQTELERRLNQLSDNKTTVEEYDRNIVKLVDEQIELIGCVRNNDDLQFLKRTLASRTEQQLKDLEQRKQSLTLNLKRINSVQSTLNSLEGNRNTSPSDTTTNDSYEPSSDTYHTAASSCCSTSDVVVDTQSNDKLMSDSGVELPPVKRRNESSDLSSNEEYDDDKKKLMDKRRTTTDSQFSSSFENRSPTTAKKRRNEKLKRLAQLVEEQKSLIVDGLDSQLPKAYYDSQISILQELQNRYDALKYGKRSLLSPTSDHPLLQRDVLESPNCPVRPLHAGSTSALYSPPLPLHGQQACYIMYSSMPSIVTDCDVDSIVNICDYHLRGTGTRTHFEYEIRVTTIDDRWSILRRYSRFRDLHLAMRSRYGDTVARIPFPSRQLFSNTENVAQKRQKQLQIYLRRLIESCQLHPNCSLAYDRPITRNDLLNFTPFFRKGLFENGKYGTA